VASQAPFLYRISFAQIAHPTMTLFILGCVLITGLVLVLLLRPLLARNLQSSADEPTLQDLSTDVLRDQMQQLEVDQAGGAITSVQYEAAKSELQRRALRELDGARDAPSLPGPLHTENKTAWAVGLAIPMLALGLYFWLGSPASLNPESARKAQMDAQATMIQGMVAQLAKRLETNPNDLEGWARLARSYKVLGQIDNAANAYAKALPFVEKQADLLVDYAEVLATQDQNDLNRRALGLVQKALVLDSQHPMSLVIAGAAAYQREDFDTAVALWERLLPLVEPGSEDAKQVNANLQDAKTKAKEKRQASSGLKK
jgi:cytochrome c-type biogenesis protein CcmH